MPKTAAPGQIELPDGSSFSANVLPDPFDARDLEYRPRLQPLPAIVDSRDARVKPPVRKQQGQSCTGHAVAVMVDTILGGQERERQAASPGPAPARPPDLPRVSPYMLYRLGRRYDEFEGEADIGSSLRGVLKGWYHHGVAAEKVWPKLNLAAEPDIDDLDWMAEHTADRPLGAYYRVSALRLDDMQSAINELRVIVASALIHEGWKEPVVLERTRRDGTPETVHLIKRDVTAGAIGGHAFALVGYNEVGFLVQNSWGKPWGKDGYATLAYEDWLDSAYDAWVARPGVPKTPFARGRSSTIPASGGSLATGAAPDHRRLAFHAVSLGGGGRLSQHGKFVTRPKDIDEAFKYAGRLHGLWRGQGLADERHIVLYAHGGLVSEEAGLAIAQRQLNWWLNNRVFPISFIWHSGLLDVVRSQIEDALGRLVPFGRVGFDIVEGVDRMIEKTGRGLLRSVWSQMKANAALASSPIPNADRLAWPPVSSQDRQRMAALPGASLVAARLKRYIQGAGEPVRVHLVGHSAGAIFLAALAERLAAGGIPIRTMALMAAGLRADEFERRVLPRVADGSIERLVTFHLSDELELDDTCPGGGLSLYHKSLLYLVSRGFEPGDREFEVPLLGMARALAQPRRGKPTLGEALARAGAVVVTAPSIGPASRRSDARHHTDFDDDTLTMSSVVMQLRRLDAPRPETEYQPHSALDAGSVPPLASGGLIPSDLAAAEAAPMPAAAAPPGDTPLTTTAEPAQVEATQAPRPEQAVAIEVADAPRSGSSTVDMMASRGWALKGSGKGNGKGYGGQKS